MSTTAMPRPTTSTQVCPLAAPATASTLSSDIETSAAMICTSALRKPSLAVGAPRASATAAPADAGLGSCLISRYIFQLTHSSRMPPAKGQTNDCQDLHRESGKGDTQYDRPGHPPKK